ncbi:MAG: hypothetical protein IPP71_14180 [Bacteroidetes bacterium]|nr:hypothetical protein [Bacteroidota bacterium]
MLKLKSDSVRFDETVFSGISINANTSNGELNISNNMNEIEISDTLKFVNVGLHGSTNKNYSKFQIATSSRDSLVTKIKVNGEANYLTNGKIQLQLLPSEIIVNNKTWEIDKGNSIVFDSTFADVQNLTITSGEEALSLNGKISKNKNDHLKLELKNFNTNVLNPILLVYDVSIGGIATGHGDFAGLLSQPGINSEMYITNLSFYNDTLGDANINFNYDIPNKLITIKGLVDRGGVKNIEVDGRYFIKEKNDSIDFNFTLQKTNLATFAGYAKGLVSDVKGKASGTLNLSGSVNNPDLTGK